MVKFTVLGLPPSVNHAWYTLPHGGRTLKKAGKKYVTETQTMLAQKYPQELLTFRKNEPHLVFFRVHLEAVENASWGALKNGAENRYKKVDVTNRIKILEDVVSKITGIDDSCTLTFITQKVKATASEMIEVFIWNTYREESPFDESLARL